MRIVISQSLTSAATGQIATRRQRAMPGFGLSGGVFRTALVSQMGHACRAALTSPPFESTEPLMLAPCPHLPTPRPGLDWRTLNAFGPDDRGERFYGACIEYSHALWQRKYAARAMLCLDRAMGADLKGDEPIVLSVWPIPYEAMVWFMRHTPHGRLHRQSACAFSALRRPDERAPQGAAPLACVGLLVACKDGHAGPARRPEARAWRSPRSRRLETASVVTESRVRPRSGAAFWTGPVRRWYRENGASSSALRSRIHSLGPRLLG
jgi:hypothetical protein